MLCESINSNQSENLKLSCLITLSYIAEEIKNSDLDNDRANKIILSLTTILNHESIGNELILQESMQAFLNCLPFIRHVFEFEVFKYILFSLLTFNLFF